MFARPGLPMFDYVRAGTREEVVDLLRQNGRAARLLMGGTDLLPRMRDGVAHPRLVVDVKHVHGLGDIRSDGPAGLTIGAAVPLNRVAGHPGVQAHFPLLAQAARSVASYQVRSRATLGGNLCNASPAADTAPAVLVLDAVLVLFGPGGEREVPAGSFFLGPGRTAMAEDEFLVALRFPAARPGASGAYLKLGRRQAGDLAVAGVAVYAFPDAAAASGCRFRVGLASVAPTPLRAWGAEEILAQAATESTFALAAASAAEASRPIDDVRASAAYRRAMVRNLTLRGLREVGPALRAAQGRA